MNKRIEELQKVADTRNLVDMLDYIVGSMAITDDRRAGVPWGGMKITLEQVSLRLIELEHMLRQTPVVHPNAVSTNAAPTNSVPTSGRPAAEAAIASEPVPVGTASGNSSGSIAGRIQMAPMAKAGRRGFSREISAGESTTSQEPGRAE